MPLYRCAACGSPNVISEIKKENDGIKYNYLKGAVGTVLLGTGGAVAGVGNSTKIVEVFRCPDCGLTLDRPMAPEICAIIDQGASHPELRESLTLRGMDMPWSFWKTKYKNIEIGAEPETPKPQENNNDQILDTLQSILHELKGEKRAMTNNISNQEALEALLALLGANNQKEVEVKEEPAPEPATQAIRPMNTGRNGFYLHDVPNLGIRLTDANNSATIVEKYYREANPDALFNESIGDCPLEEYRSRYIVLLAARIHNDMLFISELDKVTEIINKVWINVYGEPPTSYSSQNSSSVVRAMLKERETIGAYLIRRESGGKGYFELAINGDYK